MAGSIPSRLVDRVRIRQLAALCAVLLVAASLAACGGGSDSTSTTAETATTSTTQDAAGAGATGKGGGAKAGGKSEAEGKANEDEKGSAGEKESGHGDDSSFVRHVNFTPPPLEVSGGGSEQFIQKNGDNSIQEYGDEGGESELQEVAETVYDFFVARGHGEWEKACGYLTKSSVESLEQLIAQSPELKGGGCAVALKSFTQPLPPSRSRQINKMVSTIDAASFRHEGEQGFLIYYGAPGKTVYAMPMNNEDGEWKVGSLAGDQLPGF
jgi:hypothetical protein